MAARRRCLSHLHPDGNAKRVFRHRQRPWIRCVRIALGRQYRHVSAPRSSTCIVWPPPPRPARQRIWATSASAPVDGQRTRSANSASSDGFSELLKATVTGNGTGFTGVAGGSSGTINYSNATSTAGTKTGSASVVLKSTGRLFRRHNVQHDQRISAAAAYDYANAKYTGGTLTSASSTGRLPWPARRWPSAIRR